VSDIIEFNERNPDQIYRAALVPYVVESGKILMLFMKPSFQGYEGSEDWQLAKGKVEDDDQSFEDAAIREGREELGFFKGNSFFVEAVGNFMGRTAVYVAKVKDKSMFGLPSDETSDVKWLSLEDFQYDGRSLHYPVVQAAVRKIKQIENM
jgi:8-oxo-dGTP pyrophosphatase MutT (NUDIX family)